MTYFDIDYLKSLLGLAGLLALDGLTLVFIAVYIRRRRSS